jgi:ubiquinone/menaquinone biosynthesis C-methylase UbiE
VNVPSHLADPLAHEPLLAVDGGLRAADGRTYPEACGGWDLRPDAGDANNALQAEIYDAKLGEFTDFAHPHNLMLVHQRALLDRLELGHGDRVLEMGGHRSGALAYLERRGIVGSGVDIARVWVQAQNAAARARASETRWVVADAEHLPFQDRSFAAIVAFDVLEHVSRLDVALAECARVLRPGGMMVCHLPVRDIEGSLDGLQRWWDAAGYAARQASAGHFHERLPTRVQMRTRIEHVGLQVLDVQSFNVWLQPLHDHKFMPILGRLRHALQRTKPAAGGNATDAAEAAPRTGASGFQKAYARAAVPALRALSAPDRLGSLLGIGGSCSYVIRKP